MRQPANQKQHRVPQVYLKQWGYKAADDRWYIFTFGRESQKLKDERVDGFSASINIFDYPSDDPIERRHYETTAGLIERRYRSVLNSITHQKGLNKLHEDILRHFTSSLICRAEHHRKFFQDMLGDEKVVDKILGEITMVDDQDTPEMIKLAFTVLEVEQRLSLVQGIVTNHISKLLRSFRAVILKPFDIFKWFTSDNPVYLNYQDDYDMIISVTTEIYLPLSPEYCLFLFHDKSEKRDNPSRLLAPNKIHDIDGETFDWISKQLILNCRKLIIPLDMREYMEDASQQVS